MMVHPWWVYGGAIVVAAGVIALGILVDRVRRTQKALLDWAHGVDPIVRRFEDDYLTAPDDEPKTAEAHAIDMAGGLRLPAETGPETVVTGEWREVRIGNEIRRFLIGP